MGACKIQAAVQGYVPAPSQPKGERAQDCIAKRVLDRVLPGAGGHFHPGPRMA
jgi:hypothetical protein